MAAYRCTDVGGIDIRLSFLALRFKPRNFFRRFRASRPRPVPDKLAKEMDAWRRRVGWPGIGPDGGVVVATSTRLVCEKRARLPRDAGEQILALIRVGYTVLMYPRVFRLPTTLPRPREEDAPLVPSLRLPGRPPSISSGPFSLSPERKLFLPLSRRGYHRGLYSPGAEITKYQRYYAHDFLIFNYSQHSGITSPGSLRVRSARCPI